MRVLHVQYTNPGAYPPIVRGAQLLAEAGADVLMLGTHVQGLDALSVDTVNGMQVELMAAAHDGWRLKAHYAKYAAWVAREGAAWRPDWIYASDVLATPIAVVLRAMTGARVVYHEHDTPSAGHDTWVMRRCLAARQRIAREAAVVVVPNGERAQRLSREIAGGRPVLTVWNCPRRSAVLQRPRSARDGQPLHVVFRGSINADRLPATVIHAMASTSAPVTLVVAGYETAGSRGYVGDLLALAAQLGLLERVRYLGAVHPTDLEDVCLDSDVGLALMPVGSTDENMCHMVGASNKLFEYLSYGVAPLVTDLADWRAEFVAPGYALACNPASTASVQQAFEWAMSRRSELRAIADRGMARLLDDWNYEAQFAPVLRAMQSSRWHDRERDAALGRRGARCAS